MKRYCLVSGTTKKMSAGRNMIEVYFETLKKKKHNTLNRAHGHLNGFPGNTVKVVASQQDGKIREQNNRVRFNS